MRFFLTIVIVALVGCQSSGTFTTDVVDDGMDEITIEVQYVDDNFPKVSDIGDNPKKVLIWMPLIVGAISGYHQEVPIFAELASIGEPLTLDLKSQESIVEELAKIFAIEPHGGSVNVDPQSAKLARFGTFSYHPESLEPVGPTGFVSARSGDGIVLVYFNQGCRLEGTRMEWGESIEYGIVVESPGFHWIHYRETGPNSFYVSKYWPETEVIWQVIVNESAN
jgi:hypothetical protein